MKRTKGGKRTNTSRLLRNRATQPCLRKAWRFGILRRLRPRFDKNQTLSGWVSQNFQKVATFLVSKPLQGCLFFIKANIGCSPLTTSVLPSIHLTRPSFLLLLTRTSLKILCQSRDEVRPTTSTPAEMFNMRPRPYVTIILHVFWMGVASPKIVFKIKNRLVFSRVLGFLRNHLQRRCLEFYLRTKLLELPKIIPGGKGWACRMPMESKKYSCSSTITEV